MHSIRAATILGAIVLCALSSVYSHGDTPAIGADPASAREAFAIPSSLRRSELPGYDVSRFPEPGTSDRASRNETAHGTSLVSPRPSSRREEIFNNARLIPAAGADETSTRPPPQANSKDLTPRILRTGSIPAFPRATVHSAKAARPDGSPRVADSFDAPMLYQTSDIALAGQRAASANGQIRLTAGIEETEDTEQLTVPLATVPPDENVDLQREDDGLVTLIATGAELKSVLRMIADHHRLNLVLGPEIGGPVTVSIRGAHLEEVLDAILGVAGFSWHRSGNLLYVTGNSAAGMDPRVQGRTLCVYPLNYVAATDVQSVANSLLSPVGSAHISEADQADELKTRELLVVEDVPEAHRRIEQYIAQLDVPPRQVLVEAHVLQIALDEEDRHGIDLKAITRLDGTRITLDGTGFTDSNSSDASLALRIDGTDMDSVIEMIRRHTNSRTLASPKLAVVNHQEAKIQIGQRLPYSVATTTQTSTVESVEFLEVGIVLTVRPVITADGNVLMDVLPKVSGGKITQNGFPEEETTEVATTILIPDGSGVIIGGLIKEDHVQTKASVPYFSKVPLLGHFFRRRGEQTRRDELVVALVTHVLPCGAVGPRVHEAQQLEQTLPPYAGSALRHEPAPVVYYE